MTDRTISLGSLTAGVAAFAAIILGLVVGLGILDRDWTLGGVVLIAIAHGLAMRCLMCRLQTRERNAFELGRESMRAVH